MRTFIWILPLLLTVLLNAQEVNPDVSAIEAAPVTVEELQAAELESVSVAVEMINQSWFTDRTGTAVIHFDDLVVTPESLPSGVKGLSFIDIEIREASDSKSEKSTVIIRFILRDTGIVTFPSLEFFSETKHYRTIPEQLAVGSVVRTEAMSLTRSPAKRQV